MERKITNIPTKLIKRFKGEKETLELIAFAVCIKSAFRSSTIKNLSVNKVAHVCQTSKKKAKLLIERAKNNSELFVFNERNDTLTAQTFKRYRTISEHKKYGKTYSMHVIQYYAEREVTKIVDGKEVVVIERDKLRDVVRNLRAALFLNAVNGYERGDKSYIARFNSNNNSNSSLCSKSGFQMTQRNIANTMGVKRTTAVNMVKRLEKKGDIKVERGSLKVVLHAISDEAIKDAGYERKRLIIDKERCMALLMVGNTYETANRNVTESFRHIIYGHKRRLTINKSSKLNTASESLSGFDSKIIADEITREMYIDR